MADFAITSNLAARVSGMSRGRDGYVAQLDYALTHPNSNVLANNARGGSNVDYRLMGGQNVLAGRLALRWTPSDSLEVNVSGDYTRERSEAIPTVLLQAGPPSANFDPTKPGLSVDGGGTPLLVGKDGNPVPLDCHFVPAGAYSCDTDGDLRGWDPRFVSYSTFQDGMVPSAYAPFKPYFALPITEFNGWGVHGNVSYDISKDFNLVYIGAYRAYNSKFGQDQDATPVPVAQLDNLLEHHAFSSELRLNFELAAGLITGTVGGFYLDQKGTYDARVDLNYVSPTIDFINGPDPTVSSTKAVFGTLNIYPVDGLSFTGGLRYTKDKKTFTYHRTNPDGTLPNGFNCFVANGPYSEPNCILAGLDGVVGVFEGDRIDWRIVGNYRFSESLLTYASVSTGFKGGGINPRPFVADQALPFNPETLTTYEVGFKSDFLDRRVRLNGAAFYNKYNDITLGKLVCPESSLPSPCLRPDNIGSADVKGLELEASIFPVDGLSLDGSVSYLNFKYTTLTDANGFLVGSTIPGSGITPYTPEWNYSFGVQYDYETGVGTFSARFDGAYQGRLFTTAENTQVSEIPGRFLGNGRIAWTSDTDHWTVSLVVDNIFNKYYFQSVSDATTSLGVVTGVPGLPRTAAVTVKRNF